MINIPASTPSLRKISSFRQIVKNLGLLKTTFILTVTAILFSLLVTNIITFAFSFQFAGIVGNSIAVVVPAILAPLFGALNLRLLFQLYSVEDHLRLLTIRDDLTGAANRRQFIAQAQREIERAKRYGTVFSLAFMDIDDFKNINDTYGHLAGDEVLCQLAQIGMQNVRAVDIFARYAGDEFVILMPETQAQRAWDCIERIRTLAASQTVYHNACSINYTVSAGVITIDTQRLDLESLLIQVDKALYNAKQFGKNRVQVS